jgi:S1-C subfamily serine protease
MAGEAKIVAMISTKNRPRSIRQTTRAWVLLLCICSPLHAQDDPGKSKPAPVPLPADRNTPTVHLIKKCIPAIVALRTFQPGGQPGVVNFAAGSGAVIHPDGYILTNDHVVKAVVGNTDRPQGLALFSNGSQYIFKILARLPQEDIAVLKIQTGRALPFLPLGRSHDLVLGEPTLVIGNPNGLAHSVSTGIVSGLQRSTSTNASYLPSVIQTTAPISGGSSGSALINALGEIIGVITSQHDNGQNLNFAITVDHIRRNFPRLVNAENLNGFLLGIETDMLNPGSTISRVLPGSPAAGAGLRAGDIVTASGGRKITSGFEFHLALMGKSPGDELALSVRRNKKKIDVSLKLATLLSAIPLDSPPGEPGGLQYQGYKGKWSGLPDFDKLDIAEKGRSKSVSIPASLVGKEHFGLLFRGFIRVPREGVYTFYCGSDDGSRLMIGDRVLVDNNGLHSYIEASGAIKLKAGFYPLTASYFEASGEEKFSVSWEGPSIKKQKLPADALYARKPVRKKTRAPIVPCQPAGN